MENNQADWIASSDVIPADRLNELSTKYAKQVYVFAADGDVVLRVQHAHPAVQQPEGAASGELRDGSQCADQDLRRPEARVADVPDPAAELPGLQAVLPVHAASRHEVDGARHEEGAGARSRRPARRAQRSRSTPTRTTVDKALGEYFVGLLNQLGYKATLQALSPDIQYPYIQNSKNKVPFAFSDWYQDYPAASDFLNILLGCGSFHANSNSSPNIAEFCNAGIQKQMNQALKVGITDPDGGEHDLGEGRPRSRRPGAVGAALQPEAASTSCRRGSRTTSSARSGTSSSTRRRLK